MSKKMIVYVDIVDHIHLFDVLSPGVAANGKDQRQQAGEIMACKYMLLHFPNVFYSMV